MRPGENVDAVDLEKGQPGENAAEMAGRGALDARLVEPRRRKGDAAGERGADLFARQRLPRQF